MEEEGDMEDEEEEYENDANTSSTEELYNTSC